MKSLKVKWFRPDLDKSCLVIGSEGFLGRHLCPLLEANGYEVLQCDPKFGPLFERLSVEQVFLDYFPVDVIIHLGAHIQDISEREKGDIIGNITETSDLGVAKGFEVNPLAAARARERRFRLLGFQESQLPKRTTDLGRCVLLQTAQRRADS